MYDTTELGAGSYPQAPEDDTLIEFEAVVLCKIKGRLWIQNKDEAEETIETMKWDEIESTDYLSVEEILTIQEI